MYRVRVKICGITNIVDARMAEREGADALGFVFWPQSPRVIPAARVGEITRVLSPLTAKVGVFYDAGTTEVEKTIRRTGSTAAEICGTPPNGDWRNTSRRFRLIRALTVDNGRLPDSPPWSFCYDYLFHPGSQEMPVAAPDPFDWSLLPDNGDETWGRIYVSGGLTAENVGELIRRHRPYAVDVCEAVEGSNYRKDPLKIREFIAAVRAAEDDVRAALADEQHRGVAAAPRDGNLLR